MTSASPTSPSRKGKRAGDKKNPLPHKKTVDKPIAKCYTIIRG
nr:MAG TPA: hypothetical protein [Caudoviricetes sp.]